MTKELASIKGRVEQLPKLIDALSAKAKAVEARMAVLKRAGLIYAKPHWRNQKYFLLVHPMVNGERPTPTYIGTDEEKIKAATDSIARAAEYGELALQAEADARQVADACRVSWSALYPKGLVTGRWSCSSKTVTNVDYKSELARRVCCNHIRRFAGGGSGGPPRRPGMSP